MVKIKIGDSEKDLDKVTEDWINQQISRRQGDGLSVCVRVIIRGAGLDMILSTPTCGTSGGGGRPPQPREEEIFDLWNRRGLNAVGFQGGNLIAFLKQLKHIL